MIVETEVALLGQSVHMSRSRYRHDGLGLRVSSFALCPRTKLTVLRCRKGSGEIFDHHATISGTAFSYAWLSSMNAVIGRSPSSIPDPSRD